jgi:hypothetical protein
MFSYDSKGRFCFQTVSHNRMDIWGPISSQILASGYAYLGSWSLVFAGGPFDAFLCEFGGDRCIRYG